MDITQENVLDAQKKYIGENGTISGFTRYSGHMALVLVLPTAESVVKHQEYDIVRDGILEGLSVGDECIINMEDIVLTGGGKAQIQARVVTNPDDFVYPPTKDELKKMWKAEDKDKGKNSSK